MKKLFMLCAAVVLACTTYAASVDWAASSLTSYKGQTFYLFDSSDSSDVLSLLASVDANTASTLSEMSLYTGTVSNKGKASSLGLDVGSATSIFALVTEGAIGDGVGYKYITESVSSMLYTPPSTSPGTFASTLASAGTTGAMKAAPGGGTPEPTSGLLLLVGGAILALRRKQK